MPTNASWERLSAVNKPFTQSVEMACIRENSVVSEWEQWDRFTESASNGTFFHSSHWLIPLARGMGADIRVHVLLEAGIIRAGAVVRHAAKWGFRAGHKPWATAYNGVVAEGGVAGDRASQLYRALLERYHFVRLVQSPDSAEPLYTPPANWQLTRSQTPYLDLSNRDVLWKSFDRKVRQRVRKATDQGITLETSENYRVFYDLYAEVYRRQNIPMFIRPEQMEATLRLGVNAGGLRCFAAKTAEGHVAAYLVVGADSKRCYFVLAASHPEYRKTDAVTLLWWHVMKIYGTTHREVDLVGLGTDAIARFKSAFSPTLVDYSAHEGYASSPLATALRYARSLPNFRQRAKRLLRFGFGTHDNSSKT